MTHRSEADFIEHSHNTARFFVENRQVSLILLIGVIVWGWYGYRMMPKRKDPAFRFGLRSRARHGQEPLRRKWNNL
jgi:hypothetical protein